MPSDGAEKQNTITKVIAIFLWPGSSGKAGKPEHKSHVNGLTKT